MPSLGFFLAGLALLVYFAGGVSNQHYQSTREAGQSIAADSLLVAFNSARRFAENNPHRVGMISAAEWPSILPAWYSGGKVADAYTDNGRVFVWISGRNGERAHTGLANAGATQRPTIGVARNSKLIHAREGATEITLPNVIPDGALVYVS